MSLDHGAKALSLGLGLKQHHWKILIRVGWVLLVSGHIAWVCGWFAVVGLSTPFAKASDMQAVQKMLAVSTRISLQQELRMQKQAYCRVDDYQVKASIMRRIDELRDQLREIAKIDDGTGEPPCPRSL